jgi:hypothetical protein
MLAVFDELLNVAVSVASQFQNPRHITGIGDVQNDRLCAAWVHLKVLIEDRKVAHQQSRGVRASPALHATLVFQLHDTRDIFAYRTRVATRAFANVRHVNR